MSDPNKPLKPKEKMFVQEVLRGASNADAVVAAGYKPSTPESKRNMGYAVSKRPHVQNALQKAIEERYPDLPKAAADTIFGIITDPSASPAMRLKAIEVLAKVFGWNAATKHQELIYNVSETFKLPEE